MASYVASESSFTEMFKYMRDVGFPKELAWTRGIRHKFGYKDTSQPGDILKPAMYFTNSQRVGELSCEQLIRLFVGKINISELDEYPKYSGRISKEKLIEFYSLNV